MGEAKHILVLANSAWSGKYCVAGKIATSVGDGRYDVAKQWIRLALVFSLAAVLRNAASSVLAAPHYTHGYNGGRGKGEIDGVGPMGLLTPANCANSRENGERGSRKGRKERKGGSWKAVRLAGIGNGPGNRKTPRAVLEALLKVRSISPRRGRKHAIRWGKGKGF
jgi:hypothetical protein